MGENKKKKKHILLILLNNMDNCISKAMTEQPKMYARSECAECFAVLFILGLSNYYYYYYY